MKSLKIDFFTWQSKMTIVPQPRLLKTPEGKLFDYENKWLPSPKGQAYIKLASVSLE